MALTMRPTGLSSSVDQHLMDYTVYSGEWPLARIYEERGAREDQRWVWSLFGILANPPGMRTNGRAPTLEDAKVQFDATWRQWLGWAKLGEVPDPVTKRRGRPAIGNKPITPAERMRRYRQHKTTG